MWELKKSRGPSVRSERHHGSVQRKHSLSSWLNPFQAPCAEASYSTPDDKTLEAERIARAALQAAFAPILVLLAAATVEPSQTT